MMKYLLLLSTLTLSLTFSSASFAEWTLVGENVVGSRFYVDLDRIRKNDGYVYAWSLSDHLKPNEDGFMSSKSYREVDCKAFREKTLSYISYKQPMGEGEGRTSSPDNPKWRYPPPDSVIEILTNLICSQ